jgi:hypothetical protein
LVHPALLVLPFTGLPKFPRNLARTIPRIASGAAGIPE